MKGDIFIVEIRECACSGLYRIMAMSQEQAVDRALAAFKNEFGIIGMLYRIEALKSVSEVPIN